MAVSLGAPFWFDLLNKLEAIFSASFGVPAANMVRLISSAAATYTILGPAAIKPL